MNSRGFKGVRRWLAAGLALWMTAISIGVHGAHTCIAVGRSYCGACAPCEGPSPCCLNAAPCGARACAQKCSNPRCACRLIRNADGLRDWADLTKYSAGLYIRAIRVVPAIRPVVAVQKDGGACLACKFLAQSQTPAPAAAPLMSAACVCDAATDLTAVNGFSSAAYSPAAPRAPPA
jgi:hypothetical protein